jgi:hypothetical protein
MLDRYPSIAVQITIAHNTIRDARTKVDRRSTMYQFAVTKNPMGQSVVLFKQKSRRQSPSIM